MKICITSEGHDPDSKIDARFGRCRYFLIFDAGKNSYEAVENPSAQAAGGAGTRAAQMAVARGVEAVLTGNVGPNAFKVLDAAGIHVVTQLSGTVAEAVEQFKQGRLARAENPTVHMKSGMRREN